MLAEFGRGGRTTRRLLQAGPIDLDTLRTQTQPGGKELARHIVAMAQAETCSFMGEPLQGLAVMKRRLWPADR